MKLMIYGINQGRSYILLQDTETVGEMVDYETVLTYDAGIKKRGSYLLHWLVLCWRGDQANSFSKELLFELPYFLAI